MDFFMGKDFLIMQLLANIYIFKLRVHDSLLPITEGKYDMYFIFIIQQNALYGSMTLNGYN